MLNQIMYRSRIWCFYISYGSYYGSYSGSYYGSYYGSLYGPYYGLYRTHIYIHMYMSIYIYVRGGIMSNVENKSPPSVLWLFG